MATKPRPPSSATLFFSPSVYGLAIIFTFGITSTPPPPVALGAYISLAPLCPLKSGFHPPLMVTVPVLLHAGASANIFCSA